MATSQTRSDRHEPSTRRLAVPAALLLAAGALSAVGLIRVQRTGGWIPLSPPVRLPQVSVAVPEGWIVGVGDGGRPVPALEASEPAGRRRVLRVYRTRLMHAVSPGQVVIAGGAGKWTAFATDRGLGLNWAGSVSKDPQPPSTGQLTDRAPLQLLASIGWTIDAEWAVRFDLLADRLAADGDAELLERIVDASRGSGTVASIASERTGERGADRPRPPDTTGAADAAGSADDTRSTTTLPPAGFARSFRSLAWLGKADVAAASRSAVTADTSLIGAVPRPVGPDRWVVSRTPPAEGPPVGLAASVIAAGGGWGEVVLVYSVGESAESAQRIADQAAESAEREPAVLARWLPATSPDTEADATDVVKDDPAAVGVRIAGDLTDRTAATTRETTQPSPVDGSFIRRTGWYRDDPNPWIGWLTDTVAGDPAVSATRQARWRSVDGQVHFARIAWPGAELGNTGSLAVTRAWGIVRGGVETPQGTGSGPLPPTDSHRGVEASGASADRVASVPGHRLIAALAKVDRPTLLWTDSFPLAGFVCPPVPLAVLAEPTEERVRVSDDGSGPLRSVRVEILSTGVVGYWYFRDDALVQADLPGDALWLMGDDLPFDPVADPSLFSGDPPTAGP